MSSVTRKWKPPAVSTDDGALYGHIGRYAGEVVMTAFEMVGGVDRLADWADNNYGEFATKLLPKVISRPVTVQHDVSDRVDDLLKRLGPDDDILDVTPDEDD